MRKKDLIQLGATVVLAMVLIFILVNASEKSRRRNLKNVLPKAVDLARVLPDQVKKVESNDLYNLLEQQSRSIELKRDPFTAVAIMSEKTLQSGVDLTGILWDKDRPLAIIDGEIVKKGARVANKTIVEIRKDRVILSDGQILTELRLEQ